MNRLTIQYKLVADAVRALHDHATADEVYQKVRLDHPSISKGTVYRNLQRLVDEGVIRKRSFPGMPDRFDDITEPHYHAICSVCGAVIDIDMDYMADLERHVGGAHGFKLTGHDLVFHGICADCQAKQAAEEEQRSSKEDNPEASQERPSA